MKTTDKLKTLGGGESHDIKKDFSELYVVEELYTSQNSLYPKENIQAEWNKCPFNLQSQILIEKLVMISGNQKFRELNEYLTQWSSAGATRKTNDAIKQLAEHIYFQLLDAKRKGIDVEKTFSELINNSVFICNEGGYTNLQNLSMAIDGGSKLIYNAKYEYIAGVTREFLRQFESQPEYVIGNEVHYVNQLIDSIKQEYNLSPPPDMYANDQSINQVIATSKYREYIDSLFSSKVAANGILGIMVNKIALQLQEEDRIKSKFDMLSEGNRSQKTFISESLKNVFRPYVDQSVLELIEYQLLDIHDQTEDEELQGIYYLDIAGYKANYLEVIEIIIANFLDKNGYLEGISLPFQGGNMVLTENSVYSYSNTPNIDDNNCYTKEIDLRKLSELSFLDKKFIDVIRELLIKKADITNMDTLEKHLLSEEQLFENTYIVDIRKSIASSFIKVIDVIRELLIKKPDITNMDTLEEHLLSEEQLFENMDIVAIRKSIASSLIRAIKQATPDARIPDRLPSIAEEDLTKCLLLLSDSLVKLYVAKKENFSEQDFNELCDLYDSDPQKFKALTPGSAKAVYVGGAIFAELSQLYDTNLQKFQALTSDVIITIYDADASFHKMSDLYDTNLQKFQALTSDVIIKTYYAGALFHEMSDLYDTNLQKFQALTSDAAADTYLEGGIKFAELNQLYDTSSPLFDLFTSNLYITTYKAGASFYELSDLYHTNSEKLVSLTTDLMKKNYEAGASFHEMSDLYDTNLQKFIEVTAPRAQRLVHSGATFAELSQLYDNNFEKFQALTNPKTKHIFTGDLEDRRKKEQQNTKGI